MFFYFSDVARIVCEDEARPDDQGKVFEQIRWLHKRDLIAHSARGDRGAYMVDLDNAVLARLLIALQTAGVVGDPLARSSVVLKKGASKRSGPGEGFGRDWSLEKAVASMGAGDEWILVTRLPQTESNSGFAKLIPARELQEYLAPLVTPASFIDQPLWYAAIDATRLVKPIIAAAAEQ